jgi:hypothetical protein
MLLLLLLMMWLMPCYYSASVLLITKLVWIMEEMEDGF